MIGNQQESIPQPEQPFDSQPFDSQNLDGTSIAVIGMAGRFPGSDTLDEFWQNLCNGVESIRKFTKEESRAAGVPEVLLENPKYVAARGILSDIDRFDADFFDIAPNEAEFMDPQHRLFLETAWTALENAGYDPLREKSWIGVYAGSGNLSYLNHVLQGSENINLASWNTHTFMGNYPDFFASRAAYKLGLRGPAVTVRTACSTSLVAISTACQALLDYHCDLALAGGCSIHVPYKVGYLYELGGIPSPDGHCRAFDARAAGTVAGDGGGVVVLKRLEDALADRDNIVAVIRGFALNNDGLDKVGYTAPSVSGQAEAIALAHEIAGNNFEAVGYIEAHGTATPLGDPVEVTALNQAFGQQTQKTNFCAIGSVKTNIGHLDAAAGVAGVIKTILSLRHQKIVPSLHFQSPNPEIDFENSPFYVSDRLHDWPSPGQPRRAGVSSFGIGGTNAHLVLEEAPPVPEREKRAVRTWQVLPLSGKRGRDLGQIASNLAEYLQTQPDLDLSDIAYTLQVGRSERPYRQALVCQDLPSAIAELQKLADRRLPDEAVGSRKPIFQFPDWCTSESVSLNLLAVTQLYKTYSIFARALDRCSSSIKKFLNLELSDILTQRPRDREVESLTSSSIFQAAITYALAELLVSLGLEPAGTVGFGTGAYVSAAFAGVMTVDGALGLVAQTDGSGVGELVRSLSLKPPKFPLFSTIKRMWLTDEDAIEPTSWSESPSSEATSQFTLTPEQLPIDLGPTVLVGGSPGIEVYSSLSLSGDPEAAIAQIIAQAWCRGSSIDWAAFEGEAAPRRIPLPTYPFDRQRYWVEPTDRIVAKSAPTPTAKPITPLPLSKQPDLASWFYQPQWEQKLPLAPISPAAIAQRGEFWLLFLDDRGIGESFAQYLREAEIKVVAVKLQPAAEFQVLSDWEYCLNPVKVEQYRELCQNLQQRDGIPQQICHFGYVTAPETEPNPEEVFNAFLFLVRALGPQATTRLTIVSTNLHGIEPRDLPCPAKALLLGPALVIPQEYPKINCRSLDIELPKDEFEKKNLLARIFAEAVAPEEDAVVAYRGETRLARTYGSLPLPQSNNEPIDKSRLKQGGVYLIAGGLGGVGLALATFLAKHYAGKIALLTRSSFPDRESWKGILQEKRLPDLSSSIEELQKAEARLSDELAIAAMANYPGLEEKLTALCCAHAFEYVKTVFTDIDSSEGLSTEIILERLKVVPELKGCVLYLLDLLVSAGIIRHRDDLYSLATQATRVEAPETLSANLRHHYPDFGGLVELLDHCVAHYPAALTGKIPAISVLYPEGRSDFLTQTLENTIEHSREPIYRQVAAEFVAKLVAEQPERPLRILEVGAGHGLLTEVVASAVKQLEGVECEYWATDISPTFVERLEQRSQEQGWDFIETKVLDISENPLDWGLKLADFDLILALNVVHATPRIESTLFNLRSLLVPSGTLILVEVTRTPPWVDMVWGLSKGWWQFEDRHLRQRSPILSQSTWETLLREQGFALVESLPQDSKDQAATDTTLIIAQSPARAGEAWNREADREEITRHRIHRLLEIEELGGQVQVLTADIGDRDALQTQIAAVETRFGSINGVIHCAMVLDDGLMQLETPEKARQVFQPKVWGTQFLFELTDNPQRDFFVMSSSLASTIGLYAQADYSAANAFQDAFAHRMNLQGNTFVCSINWGIWSDAGAAMRLLMDSSIAAPRRTWVNHPLFEYCVDAGPGRRVYHARLSTQRHWMVAEHRLGDRSLVPGTGFLELARAAYQDWQPCIGVELRDVYFLEPLVVPESTHKEVRIVLEERETVCDFTIFSLEPDRGWYEHARGNLVTLSPGDNETVVYHLEALKRSLTQKRPKEMGVPANLKDLKCFGDVCVGPRWYKSMLDISIGQNQALTEVILPDEYKQDLEHYHLHPAMLDVATSFALTQEDFYLPFSYKKLRLYRPLPQQITAYARYLDKGRSGAATLSLDILLLDATGATCASIEGFTLKKVTAEVYETSSSPVAPPDLHPELRQGMSGVEGAEAFQRILNQSLPQVLVSTQDFAGVQARNKAMTMLRFKESALPELREFTATQWKSEKVETTETVSGSFESQQGVSGDIGSKVVEIFCQVLGVKNIELEDDFFDLNGDSLQAIMVTSRIRDLFGVDLGPDALFDYSTAAELAKAIQAQNQPVIDRPLSQSEDAGEMLLRQQVDNLSDEEVEAMLKRLN